MRRTRFVVWFMLVAAPFLCLSAVPTFAADKIGIVLMHGKTGTASARGPLGSLISKLKSVGFLVEAPDMPWSRQRFLAKDYEGSMAEIDAAVARLKRRGATKIVVSGHSMGGAAAIGYGARRDGLAGVVAIAPGHDPELYGFQKQTDFDYRRAKEMIDKGRGNAYGRFNDTNVGKRSKVRVKASVYYDWYNPEGPAGMKSNVAKLKPETPLLVIYGKADPLLRFGQQRAFEPAPKNPKSSFEEVSGSHMQTPSVSAGKIIDWIKAL